jgi:hypothetical protein
MRFRLAALAALLPMTAVAGPQVGPTLVPELPQQTYHALAPNPSSATPRNGWGLRASVDGRWTDLRTPARLDWSADPQVPPSDVQAGVEWRHGGAAAVLGYGQYDEGAAKDPELWDRTIPQETSKHPSDPGVLGLSFVFRSR